MKKTLMRFTFPLALLAIVGGGIIVGCEKQEKLTDLNQTVQKAQQAEVVTPEANYDDVFKATTGMLDEGSYLTITKAEGGYVFTVKSGTISAARTVVCHDTSASLSFAKCCRDYVIANGCIQVSVGSGGWNGYGCAP